MSAPRSPVGAALAVYHEAVERVEAMYRAQEGEVTEEVEVAETFADLARDEALESAARFMRWLDDADAAIDRETERLRAARARVESRREWVTVHALALLDECGAKSKAIGAFKVKSRVGSERVVVDDDFDLSLVPEELVRVKPPVPEVRELDKVKAKAWLKTADSMPIPGLSLERGPRKVVVE